jgi:hypothetical protein
MWCFRQSMMLTNGSPGGNVWLVATVGIVSRAFAYAETADGVFRSVRSTAGTRVNSETEGSLK